MHPTSKIGALVIACSLLSLAACSDDDDDRGPLADAGAMDAGQLAQPVTIRFKAKLGSEDLRCGQSYANQGSSKVAATPQDFRFFVQEVRLISVSGEEVPVRFDERAPFQTKDVALIDFTDAMGKCELVGGTTVNTTITGTVPSGRYNGVVFVNGVPDPLNHADPTVAPAPLQARGASWDWRNGYRFIMAELAPTGTAGAPPPMDAGVPPVDGGVTDAGARDAGTGSPHGGGEASAVHVGSTSCDRSPTTQEIFCVQANRTRIRLPSFDPTTQSIVADLSAVFATVDLTIPSQCHGSGPTCVSTYAALGVDRASGAALPTQTVFRVE